MLICLGALNQGLMNNATGILEQPFQLRLKEKGKYLVKAECI